MCGIIYFRPQNQSLWRPLKNKVEGRLNHIENKCVKDYHQSRVKFTVRVSRIGWFIFVWFFVDLVSLLCKKIIKIYNISDPGFECQRIYQHLFLIRMHANFLVDLLVHDYCNQCV